MFQAKVFEKKQKKIEIHLEDIVELMGDQFASVVA